jgi:RNA polymerase sigma factor (sigma-70 family)
VSGRVAAGRAERKDSPEERLRDLFDANAVDLLDYLARRVSPVEDAADLLSDTLLTACRHARTLPTDPERARMWLFVTARNALRNHARGKRRRHALAERLASALLVEEAAVTDDREAEVRAAIDALDPESRELIRLVYWDGFTIAQAAELVGIPASTARGRLQVTRNQLRTILGDLSSIALDPA